MKAERSVKLTYTQLMRLSDFALVLERYDKDSAKEMWAIINQLNDRVIRNQEYSEKLISSKKIKS